MVKTVRTLQTAILLSEHQSRRPPNEHTFLSHSVIRT